MTWALLEGGIDVTKSSPEPTDPAEDPQSQNEAVDSFTPEDVFAFVVEEACRRDPRNAHHYRGMDAARVKDGVEVTQELLAVHRTLLGRWGRGARTRKRQHAQQIYALLTTTNEANVTLAMCYLEAAFALLPPSPPDD
jgi:hypothetical protein